MFKRPLFWFGLLLGSLTALGLLARPLKRLPRSLKLPLDLLSTLIDGSLITDALIVCDSAGSIIHSTAAARTLFGPDCSGQSRLRYPNGQAVPPGQLPLARALRTREAMPGALYHAAAGEGIVHVLDVSAQPLPDGGAAAVFRDITEHHAAARREDQAEARQRVLQRLGRRLNRAATSEAISRAVAEEVHTLLHALPAVQVRLYRRDFAAQTLVCLASEPEDFPKRPKTLEQSQPPVLRFDASNPALWQVYVSRQPTSSALLLEPAAASVYALPLVAGGIALGHLGLSSSAEGAFGDPVLQETLPILASLAALALAAPTSAALASALISQADAVREITQALAAGTSAGQLADLVTGHIRRITNAELCTVSLDINGKLTLIGEASQDDLLLPETASHAPMLHGKAVQKAWRTQKIVMQPGTANALETGPWRMLAGKSEPHLVTALPLAARLGVLTVYTMGVTPLPEAQMQFLQTVAALVSISVQKATAGEER